MVVDDTTFDDVADCCCCVDVDATVGCCTVVDDVVACWVVEENALELGYVGADEVFEDGNTGPADVFTIAGSCIKLDGNCGLAGYGSHTCKSSISLPRNIIYSNTSSRGCTGRSVGRSSVPNERT